MLTGGSVPIGDVDGTVFRAPSQTKPLTVAANVSVQFRTLTGQVLQETRTDAEGKFILTVPQTEGVVTAFDRTTGQEAVLMVMGEGMIDAGVNLTMVLDVPRPEVTTLAITPAKVDALPLGASVTFTTTSPQTSATLYPSWAVRGKIGTIAPDGVFTATKIGAGKIMAQVGAAQASVLVKVRKPSPTP